MSRLGGAALGRPLAALVLAFVGVAAEATPQEERGAVEAYRSGRVDEAIAHWQGQLRRGEADAGEVRMLVDALMRRGRSIDAEAVARDWVQRRPDGGELATRWGRALLRRGDAEGARQAWERAVAAAATDALTARLQLAILDFESGRRQQAMAAFDLFVDVYNRGQAAGAEDLLAIAVACTYLGIDEPALFQDAVRALEEAMAADPSDPEPRLRLAELFLDKYDSGEAVALLQDVLRVDPSHPRALLAMARTLQFDGKPGVSELLAQAREQDPELVEAMAFEGGLLLQAERRQDAATLAMQALEIDPRSFDAMAVLAASHFLRERTTEFDAVVSRALALDPSHGALHREVAEAAVQNRLYRQAVDLARRAVELDPRLWSAWGTLGLNQLRIGEIEAGRASLEKAFDGDPYNVWIKNTLDLLDTWDAYDTVPTTSTQLFLQSDTAAALRLHMQPIADEAYAALGAKYEVEMPDPLRVEVYRRHADFSVRTVGLAGLGALGVAFGPVVAVDAPAAPGMGEFNWASTLWHEIAHVATLTASGHRVPRWLTEGLSVYEERRARPGWGAAPDPGFFIAWLQGRLLPVSRINEGFVRPAYPEHIGHSYVQASLVCEWIEQEGGFEAIKSLLRAYRDGRDNEAAMRSVLGRDAASVDAAFGIWLEQRYASELQALQSTASRESLDAHAGVVRPSGPAEAPDPAAADPGDFVAQLRVGRALVEDGRPLQAVEYLERARALVPGHAAPDSAYALLAGIHEQAGDLRRAAEVLEAMIARNDSHAAAYVRLADLYERLGERRRAAEVLQRVVWIEPLQPALQRRLAELWEAVQDWDAAVLARRTIVELRPADGAEAWFRLAAALLGQGDRAAARRAVLRALEIAPGYVEAQELLLQLRREATS